jgi:hypothetical protein
MMDTKTLITEAKARFAHNSAKDYLKEKYNAKLLVAEQGGLWKADKETIAFLTVMINDYDDRVVLIDTFNNPVLVERSELLTKLKDVYRSVMAEWYNEWKELESKR